MLRGTVHTVYRYLTISFAALFGPEYILPCSRFCMDVVKQMLKTENMNEPKKGKIRIRINGIWILYNLAKL